MVSPAHEFSVQEQVSRMVPLHMNALYKKKL
jgi:hypothetical protein